MPDGLATQRFIPKGYIYFTITKLTSPEHGDKLQMGYKSEWLDRRVDVYVLYKLPFHLKAYKIGIYLFKQLSVETSFCQKNILGIVAQKYLVHCGDCKSKDCLEVGAPHWSRVSVWFIVFPVFLIRFILIRIRIQIRGSASGITDPDPVPDPTPDPTNSNFFLLIFFCKRYKAHNDVFFCNFELIIRVY